jgi:hypothetical protein
MGKKKKMWESNDWNNLTEAQELGDITSAETPEGQVLQQSDNEYLKLTAKQWTIAKGIRAYQSGGFIHWAGSKFGKNHKLTSAQWPILWEEFLNQPV